MPERRRPLHKAPYEAQQRMTSVGKMSAPMSTIVGGMKSGTAEFPINATTE
jgi:hypothetical protein